MRWVQLCGNLSILWHCLSLGLEWKLTFSSPVATAEPPGKPPNQGRGSQEPLRQDERDQRSSWDSVHTLILSRPHPGSIVKSESEVAQSCPTLCDPVDCSLWGYSVHGIFQAIVLEWIAISFSRGSSQPRDRTPVSRIVDRCFTVWATREVLLL